MDYKKLIKEEIAKLHTVKGLKVNPKLDSDLGEEIVASICRRVVKNCRIANIGYQREQLPSKEDIYSEIKRVAELYYSDDNVRKSAFGLGFSAGVNFVNKDILK